MQTQSEPRLRKRLPCTLSMEARRHNGMILNLSSRGLFVQTSLPAEPGTLLDLDVHDPLQGEAIPLQAAVVWRRRVSPRMTGVNQSGMGLRLLNRPTAWQTMMSDLLGSTSSPDLGQPDVAEPTSAHRVEEPPTESTPAPEPVFRFDVRLAETGGPRSRRVVVEVEDETAAGKEARRIAGEGWTVLEIRRRR